MASNDNGNIGLIGSGMIGRSWAMIFASAGFRVFLYDIKKSQVDDALQAIQLQLKDFEKSGCLRGNLSAVDQLSLISGTTSLEHTVQDAVHIQECVPENVDLKRQVFTRLDDVIGENTVIASSSSCIPSSQFTEKMKRRSQCLVAHPVNPPYFTPLVEIVPSEWTSQNAVDKTKELMQKIGQIPVCLQKEIPGFALNRMQYAVVNEAWRLVEDGVISAEDIDKVMWAGLGQRYAFMGPLEVLHLNAEGIGNNIKNYGDGMRKVNDSYGPHPNYDGQGLQTIVDQMNARIPLDQLEERRQWRDKMLAGLSKLKKEGK